MKALRTSERRGSKSTGEASPYQQASSYYQRSKRTRTHSAAEQPATRARRNPVVDDIRLRLALGEPLGGKQPGRRYGPSPKNWADKRATATPMPTSRRVLVYQRQNGRLLGMTRRQLRQIARKSLAHARLDTKEQSNGPA